MKTITARSRVHQKVCNHCKKQFYACRMDKQTCSAACSRQLRLKLKESEKIVKEVKELYETYQENVKKSHAISF